MSPATRRTSANCPIPFEFVSLVVAKTEAFWLLRRNHPRHRESNSVSVVASGTETCVAGGVFRAKLPRFLLPYLTCSSCLERLRRRDSWGAMFRRRVSVMIGFCVAFSSQLSIGSSSMKTIYRNSRIATSFLLLLATTAVDAQELPTTGSLETRFGKLELESGYPSRQSF